MRTGYSINWVSIHCHSISSTLYLETPSVCQRINRPDLAGLLQSNGNLYQDNPPLRHANNVVSVYQVSYHDLFKVLLNTDLYVTIANDQQLWTR